MSGMFFAADAMYKAWKEKYTRLDAMMAWGLYALIFGAYFMLRVFITENSLLVSMAVQLFLVFVCAAMVKLRGQGLSSVGLSKERLKKSFLLGFIAGICYLLFAIQSPAFSTAALTPEKIAFNALYYFLIIGFVEELLFRGYIQTRIYGWIKHDVPAILLVGLLYCALRVPFGAYGASEKAMDYIIENRIPLAVTFIWHLALNFMYRKFNSLAAPVLFRGFISFSGSLFQ